MKINIDIFSYLSEKYGKFKKTVREASRYKDKDGNYKYFVKSDYPAFIFDDILKLECGNEYLKSCDAVVEKDNSMIFVEFKQGFSKLRFSQDGCPQLSDSFNLENNKCKECLRAYNNLNETKFKNFKLSISNKILGALIVLIQLILPNCNSTQKMPLKYILVLDIEDSPRDSYGEMLYDLSNRDNVFRRIEKSVERFRKEYSGQKILFESTEVMFAKKFDEIFEYNN